MPRRRGAGLFQQGFNRRQGHGQARFGNRVNAARTPKRGWHNNAPGCCRRLLLVPFTVPEQLREPIRAAMKPWYGALLKESAGALQDLASQPKHLGAELGPTALLQTWTRDLRYHPHVHLLMPGGGLTPNRLRWVRVAKPEFFLPQVKLAARFKGRLKAWLKEHEPELYAQVPAKVWWLKWVADIQPVGSGEAALKYLAAYLCRPPLHESQGERWDAQSVTFRYRENDGNQKSCTVSVFEFVRRFLQHVLPNRSPQTPHSTLRRL